LICRIQDLISRNWQIQFKHIQRKGNKSAEWLANQSFTHNSFDVMMPETSLRELQSIIFNDISRTCIPKIVRIAPWFFSSFSWTLPVPKNIVLILTLESCKKDFLKIRIVINYLLSTSMCCLCHFKTLSN
jgi:hypothetical protein